MTAPPSWAGCIAAHPNCIREVPAKGEIEPAQLLHSSCKLVVKDEQKHTARVRQSRLLVLEYHTRSVEDRFATNPETSNDECIWVSLAPRDTKPAKNSEREQLLPYHGVM